MRLQKVAQDLNMNRPNRYELQLRSAKKDESSPCIIRDMKKCILCGRCMEVCGKVQGIQVMAKENRGFHTEIVPPYGKELVDTSCVAVVSVSRYVRLVPCRFVIIRMSL